MRQIPHITVCICTYKRPQLLEKLLLALEGQRTDGLFTFSGVVVDNDCAESARGIVTLVGKVVKYRIEYYVEPRQNIALARNRAVQCAKGNFVAFMDDDEFPGEDWLIRLYLACWKYRADGALGPVKPLYTPDTPSWLKRSRLCERPSHKSGTALNDLQTRSGNVLFKRSILEGMDEPFPPEKGRTGGEDIEFFERVFSRGYVFVWCEEAPVYEKILPERFRRMYYIEKSLRIGGLTGEMVKDWGFEKWSCLLRSGCSAIIYTFGAVAGLLLGPHVSMKYFVKIVYHLGRMCGCFGFVPIRERPEQKRQNNQV